ncbi:hypothetical protein [Luteolibacter luteus]|uniref:Uncharacterized protein n=1 Tax=Luteolibacter luteus TaxID=2728835 RepID=A0A858RNA5_9BACT|nr:hypothetical protein [Luteolibacter luteus]QJE98205.1 hypothetical protein HHL09_21250 [Luteolibacter luteus]
MTAQERINQLAGAALRAGPPPAAQPKPATFMPSFEKMKSAEFIAPQAAATPAENPVQAIAAFAPAPVPATATAADVIIPTGQNESDEELRTMLDARDEVKHKKTRRTGIIVTLSMLSMLAAGGTWFATSESAQAKARFFVQSVRECGRDIKGMTQIMGTYEKQLDKVAVQGARIDAATSALGVDPNTDTSAQGAEIEGAMSQMSGQEGPTVSERNKAMQAKFGIVSKVAGENNPKVQKAESDVKF